MKTKTIKVVQSVQIEYDTEEQLESAEESILENLHAASVISSTGFRWSKTEELTIEEDGDTKDFDIEFGGVKLSDISIRPDEP